MKKIIAALAISSIAVFASGCSSSTPTPAVTVTVTAPAPDPVVNNVSTAPSECGDVMDLAQQMSEAVSKEHSEFGEAANKASVDMDISAFVNSMTDAMATMTSTVSDITPKMAIAAPVCRAAVK